MKKSSCKKTKTILNLNSAHCSTLLTTFNLIICVIYGLIILCKSSKKFYNQDKFKELNLHLYSFYVLVIVLYLSTNALP